MLFRSAKPAPAKKGGHLYLVDGSGYIFRAYHALPKTIRRDRNRPAGAILGHLRTDGRFAYVTESHHDCCFIVVDLASGRAWKKLAHHRLTAADPALTAWVQGRDVHHAELAARIDALLQIPVHSEHVYGQVITPLAAGRSARRETAARKAAATKVEFYTLARESRAA